MKNPQDVVQRMLEQDHFSQWMELKVNSIAEGTSTVSMFVKQEMLNGFGVIHGGVLFSLADSAFAFACNNRNNLSVALDTSINFIKPVHIGDVLIAEARELHNGKSTGLYQIEIYNQKEHLVAQFKGLCYRTGKPCIK